jgi:hypothetical protein
MPFNPFPSYYAELQDQAINVQNFWASAQSQLSSVGAPDTIFLDIGLVSGKIVRLSDGAQVLALTDSEKLALFPHLNGLFKKASNAVLLP